MSVVKMLVSQMLTPEKMSKAATSLSNALKSHALQPGELMPMMVINPSGGKLTMDIIVMKVEDDRMVYTRCIDSKEITVDYLMETLSGVTI